MRKQKAERSALGFYFQSGKMNGASNTAKWLLYATGKSVQSTVSVLEKMYLTKHHPYNRTVVGGAVISVVEDSTSGLGRSGLGENQGIQWSGYCTALGERDIKGVRIHPAADKHGLRNCHEDC